MKKGVLFHDWPDVFYLHQFSTICLRFTRFCANFALKITLRAPSRNQVFFLNHRQHLNLSIAPKCHTIWAWTPEIIEGIDVFVSLKSSSIKRNVNLRWPTSNKVLSTLYCLNGFPWLKTAFIKCRKSFMMPKTTSPSMLWLVCSPEFSKIGTTSKSFLILSGKKTKNIFVKV